MKKLLIATAFATLLPGCASMGLTQASVEVQMGTPPPPPRFYRVRPQPGPVFVWVEGYWYPQGNRYRWHDGYWTRAPYPGAYWVEPYWWRGRYYIGYWVGPRGRVEHNHRWDRRRERDEGRRYRDDD